MSVVGGPKVYGPLRNFREPFFAKPVLGSPKLPRFLRIPTDSYAIFANHFLEISILGRPKVTSL